MLTDYLREYTAFAYYEQYVINDDLGGKALFNHARQLATEADCGFYTVAKGEEDRKRLIGFGFKDTGLCSDSNHILLGSTPSTNKRVPHEVGHISLRSLASTENLLVLCSI